MAVGMAVVTLLLQTDDAPAGSHDAPHAKTRHSSKTGHTPRRATPSTQDAPQIRPDATPLRSRRLARMATTRTLPGK